MNCGQNVLIAQMPDELKTVKRGRWETSHRIELDSLTAATSTGHCSERNDCNKYTAGLFAQHVAIPADRAALIVSRG